MAMAHINISTSITRNRKFKRFKRYLDKDDAEAVGHLACLWANVLELAEDGDISKWTKEDIAEYAHFTGEPDKIYEALTLKNASFLENKGKKRLISNWWDYAGRYLTAKYRTSNPLRLQEIRSLYQSVESLSPVGKNTRILIDKIDKIDIQKAFRDIVNHFKNLKEYDTLTNPEMHFKYAKQLFGVAGSVERAKEAMSWLAAHFEKEGLTWKMATLVSWYPEWEKQQKVSQAQTKQGEEAQAKIEKMRKDHEKEGLVPKGELDKLIAEKGIGEIK